MKNEIMKKKSIDLVLAALIAIFIFLPLIQVSVICAYNGVSIKQIMSFFNDEIGWFNLSRDIIRFNKYLGYNGYYESHAIIGGGGPWGVAILIPYVIFGKIFGWHFYSPLYANIVFTMVANGIFCLLVKPKKQNIILLILVNLVLFISTFYLITYMSETIRYSEGIILCGILYRLVFNYDKTKAFDKVLIFIITPIFIVFAMLSYIMFWFSVPVYFYILYKNYFQEKMSLHGRKFYIFAVSIFTVLFTCIIFYITTLTASPYTVSTIGYLIKHLKNGLGDGIYAWIQVIITNTQPIGVFSLLNMDGGIYPQYILCYYFIIILLLINIIKKIKKKEFSHDLILNGTAFTIMLIFILWFILLYLTKLDIFVRGINVALVFSMYLLSLQKDKKTVIISICIMSFLIIPATVFISTQINLRNDDYKFYEQKKETLTSVMEVDQNNLGWENTVAVYGEYTRDYLSLPDGMATNGILRNDFPIEKSKYAAICKKNAVLQKQITDMLLGFDYFVLYEDDRLVIFKNNRYNN